MNELKKLVILTENYPYTKYEAFMETEIAELANYFDFIYIIPGKKDIYKRELPYNTVTINLLNNNTKDSINLKEFFFAIKITCSELFGVYTFKKIKHFKKDLLFIISKLKEAKRLEKYILDNKLQHAIYYSVWAYNYATVLSILKDRKIINNFYCRAHGFDVYHFRRPVRGYSQFLEYNIKHCNKIVCASQAMQHYLNQYYTKWKNKYTTINLSVYDRGINPFKENMNPITVLSVSNFHAVKRLHLIVEVLNNTSIPIKWIHIGAPPQKMKELSKTLKPDIKTEFVDMITQSELVHFYNTTPVNLFLHFSESEGGVPLAIQEAVSFGIPVLATDVGGIPEIINKKNGILLPVNLDIPFTASIINNFHANVLNTHKQRIIIKEDWNNRFNAVINFNKFAQILLSD